MHLAPIVPPDASIKQTDKEIIVRWGLPGCEDIEVYVDKRSLSLNCSIRHSEDNGDTRISYSCVFRQRLYLPVTVKGTEARTSYHNGVLEVIIDKE